MQLGARWRVGEAPHRSVPSSLFDEIALQEQRFPAAHSWTLTWLEGRPRASLDDLVIVTQDGTETLDESASSDDADEHDEDDWLS